MTKSGSGSPTVNERLMSREAPASITLAVVHWYWACDTSRSAYKRATHHGVDVRETSGQEQMRERDVSMENVVRDNYVKGLWISCDPNALASGSAYEINQVVDFMRRTRQLIAYRRDVVFTLCLLHKCTPLNVLHWLHLLSIHSEYILLCSIYWIK